MAEPQSSGGLTGELWRDVSQAAVDAIRVHDMTTEIHVAGFSWSNTPYWEHYNGPTAWIIDPANRIRYEAHHYWDSDYSGSYSENYAETLLAAQADYEAEGNPDALHTRIFAELQRYTDWLDANDAQGILGEIGWPDEPEYATLATAYLAACKQLNLPVIGWFAGDWAGDWSRTRIYEGEYDISIPRPQAAVWKTHLT